VSAVAATLERRQAATRAPLIEVRNLKTYFPVGNILNRRIVRAVDDVSFSVGEGEVVGLVGESGSGKTTVGRSILRLVEPTAGEVIFEGRDLVKASKRELRRLRKPLQIIFQDPFASLNPRMTVGQIVSEGLTIHKLANGQGARDRVAELLGKVGLSPSHAHRYPHEFSGGQRQRIGIARALAVDARFIVADEPVSALDVSIQAQVINLLQDLQQELGLSLLVISHDLSVVEHISDSVIVMYLGRVMEVGRKRQVFANPRHPYTEALLSAKPRIDPERRHGGKRIILKGDIPSPIDPPSGCVFRTRCPIAVEECARVVPPLEEAEAGHLKACIRR
jgi:peptide/nickel transport system ATP-binding protein